MVKLYDMFNDEENDGPSAYIHVFSCHKVVRVYIICCHIGCCHDHHSKLVSLRNSHYVVALLYNRLSLAINCIH